MWCLKKFAGFKRLIEENPIYKDMVLIGIEPCAAEIMRVIVWFYMKDIFDILMSKGKPKLAIRYAKRIIKDGQGISDDPQILDTGGDLAADNGCLQYRGQDVRGELQWYFRISGIIRLLSAVLYDDGLCLNMQRRCFYIFQFILR